MLYSRIAEVKFKKHHGFVRDTKEHYLGHIRPFLWRPQKVLNPPAFLVHRAGPRAGAPADAAEQLPARPFYTFGVSHSLFPTQKPGFKMLRRRARDGQWEVHGQRYKMQPDVIPRR